MVTNQALTETLDDDFTGEVPIILSATRLAQPQSEAPVATTIIDSLPHNPSSVHSFGQEAKNILTKARATIADYCGVKPLDQ